MAVNILIKEWQVFKTRYAPGSNRDAVTQEINPYR